MIVEIVPVGILKENCYILKKDNDALIVDPGDQINLILEKLGDYNLKGILITHAHNDHIGALDDLLNKYDVPVFYNNVNNEIKSKNVININEKKYNISNFNFEVIYTKGHRNDLCTFYFYEEKIMFTGDFIFYESIGRTDFEYSDYYEMKKSIEKIEKYDDDITIYPGHGIKTTISHEKKYNIYFNME